MHNFIKMGPAADRGDQFASWPRFQANGGQSMIREIAQPLARKSKLLFI